MTEPQHTTNVSPPPTFLSYRQLEEAHQRIEANGRQDLGEKKLNPRTCINLTTQGYSVDISREAQPGEFNKSRGENKFKHGYPWVFFSREHDTSNDKKFGWKFHIALDDSDQTDLDKGNIAHAYSIVQDVLMQHQVNTFKIVGSTFPLIAQQARKQVTIYGTQNDFSPEKWQEIFDEITMRFVDAEIKSKPPFPGESDRAMQGSSFLLTAMNPPMEMAQLILLHSFMVITTFPNNQIPINHFYQSKRFIVKYLLILQQDNPIIVCLMKLLTLLPIILMLNN